MIHSSDNTVNILVCTSIGGCVTGFVSSSLPYLQFAALIISIVAGLSALWQRYRK